mmetsp:Transcript_33012/g.69021  ORF Transcript_33012/g.69021 Transcript_33012/m.69021 type:complete len:217 (-) Transcript_33012:11-661(-)
MQRRQPGHGPSRLKGDLLWRCCCCGDSVVVLLWRPVGGVATLFGRPVKSVSGVKQQQQQQQQRSGVAPGVARCGAVERHGPLWVLLLWCCRARRKQQQQDGGRLREVIRRRKAAEAVEALLGGWHCRAGSTHAAARCFPAACPAAEERSTHAAGSSWTRSATDATCIMLHHGWRTTYPEAAAALLRRSLGNPAGDRQASPSRLVPRPARHVCVGQV